MLVGALVHISAILDMPEGASSIEQAVALILDKLNWESTNEAID